MQILIDFVNLSERFVVLSDDRILPIVSLIDDEGCDCGPDDACVAVVGDDRTGYFDFEIPADVGMVN